MSTWPLRSMRAQTTRSGDFNTEDTEGTEDGMDRGGKPVFKTDFRLRAFVRSLHVYGQVGSR